MKPPPVSLKVGSSKEECCLELAKLEVPDKDIDLLSEYIAANYNERRVLHMQSVLQAREALACHYVME